MKSKTTLALILVMLAVFVAIAAAAYFFKEEPPDPAEIRDLDKKDRQISSLKSELESLTRELEQVRRDYAALIAERRCEVIDGMDDCLAAGLQRPERFRDTDRELVRQREADRAKREAQQAVASRNAGTKPAPADAAKEESMMRSVVNLLKSIPGVKLD
jgi:hypothetical protein